MDGEPVMMYPAVINTAGKSPLLLESRMPPGDTSGGPGMKALPGMCFSALWVWTRFMYKL